MANWSDPRQSAAPFGASRADAARSGAYDAGLRSYMLSVYNYMASGVLLTGIVALLFATSVSNNLDHVCQHSDKNVRDVLCRSHQQRSFLWSITSLANGVLNRRS